MSSSLDDVPALIGTNARGFYHELTGGKMEKLVLLSHVVYVYRLLEFQWHCKVNAQLHNSSILEVSHQIFYDFFMLSVEF